MAHHAPPLAATLVDVRRSDERALYGAIQGSAHIPGGCGFMCVWFVCVCVVVVGGDAGVSFSGVGFAMGFWRCQRCRRCTPPCCPLLLPTCCLPSCSGPGGERPGAAARRVCGAVPLCQARRRRPRRLYM